MKNWKKNCWVFLCRFLLVVLALSVVAAFLTVLYGWIVGAAIREFIPQMQNFDSFRGF